MLAVACAATALTSPAWAQRGGAATSTEYALFWRGDLRIIATRDNTQITILDLATGAPIVQPYTANVIGNPFELRNAGDAFEANNGTETYRIRVVATYSRGMREDKPVIVWTGNLEAALKHPAVPPTTTNAWMSFLPALAPGSIENGTEAGRDLWGFTSREMRIIARRGAAPTTITVEDVANNVSPDADDSVVLTPASPALVHRDAFAEVYVLDQFEDDTVHVTANVDVTVLVGIGGPLNDWTITPPSLQPGEDFRELGTLFYAQVARDLTIFPTQDRTTVTITDLSDGDDSTTFTLPDGDLAGDYSVFVTDLWARNGTGLVGRPAAPAVSLVTGGSAAPFEDDLVRIESDRPVLVYVGPKAADTNEYADVAYSVRTGPSSFLLYAYAQNGGADDLQLFAYDAATQVRITSLSQTSGFRNNGHHDFLIPATTPWSGGNATTGDWYWGSGIWNGELLRFEANAPITIIDGDYDAPNFGCFIPFVSDAGLLRPIADAGPDLSACPGTTSVRLDGSASFDADSTPGAAPPSWAWDVDASVDDDGDGDFSNDRNLIGEAATFDLVGAGPWTITLTFTDDDGQVDTDVVVVRAADARPPLLTCPSLVTASADANGSAFAPVIATATDACDAMPDVVNDRTSGGTDASDTYPCGETPVAFDARDDAGNAIRCVTRVVIAETTPPDVACGDFFVVPDDTFGATVPALATVTDRCAPAPVVTNDRTSGGLAATDFYPCGLTHVAFTATDSGGIDTCTASIRVSPPTSPVGLSPQLRASKVAGRDERSVVRLHWTGAGARPAWQWHEVRRTADAPLRPYPVIASDRAVPMQEHVDDAAAGDLWFYQVHVHDCLDRMAPGPMEPSP